MPPIRCFPPLEEEFRLLGYIDDLKIAITSMWGFIVVDKNIRLFEDASVCKLYRAPSAGKVKFLLLGRWRGVLQQEDIPVRYIKISKHLYMFSVKLKSA